MSGTFKLNDTERSICDRIFLIRDDDIIDIYDVFVSTSDAADIVGLPPETLNTLQEIANRIGNDANVLNNITTQNHLKMNISDSYGKRYVDNVISNYYTSPEINTNIALQLDASVINSYYDKTYVDNLIDN